LASPSAKTEESQVSLATDRLLLREARTSHVSAFEEYMLPEHYWHHALMEPPTKESVAALVGRYVRSQVQKSRMDFFLIAVDKLSQEFVGEATLRVRSFPQRQGAIRWGVTFATEIGRALLRLAFDTLNLHRVEAQCRSENHASRRIMA
jgi:[ribosomal protein S5]-alanine N-acetyltransferase